MAVHEMFRGIQMSVSRALHSESTGINFDRAIDLLHTLEEHPAHQHLRDLGSTFTYQQDKKTRVETVTLKVPTGVSYTLPQEIQGFTCTDTQELPDGAHAYVFTVTR